MTEIRILFYTDYEGINEKPSPNSWGITDLKKFIRYKTQGIAEVKIDLINRHDPKPKSQPLTRKLLYQYDELWVFGFHRPRASPFELDVQEVAVLKEWMDNGGGLFMTGDHATGNCAAGDPNILFAWGRSLGEPMKRAGQLRVWQGPPTSCPHAKLEDRDNYNTCEGSNPLILDRPALQSDDKAQNLILHDPPHRLFWRGKDTSGKPIPITRFPDHHHEGKLVIPEKLDSDWPPHSPSPVVAAEGNDKRFPGENRNYKLVVAYDGDPVKVGRIVVDSSFHHYLNINLSDLLDRDKATGFPVKDSDLDQIAQYYGNLAYWLAPQVLRDEIKLDLFFQLSAYPDVFEVSGSGIRSLGQAAQYALDLQIGDSNLHRIFAPAEFEMAPRSIDKLLAVIFLGSNLEGNSSIKLTPQEREAVLGAVVEAHHEFVAESGADTPEWLDEKPPPLDMIERGIASLRQLYPSASEKLLPLFRQASDEHARRNDDQVEDERESANEN